jgi:hypothetical protein
MALEAVRIGMVDIGGKATCLISLAAGLVYRHDCRRLTMSRFLVTSCTMHNESIQRNGITSL